MTTEEWCDIPDWEGLYQVSNYGNVRSLTRQVKGRSGPTWYQGRVLKPSTSTGYNMVTLAETGRGRRKQFYNHDLVLHCFVGPKPVGLEVCHGPLGELDNSLDNIRYDTRKANAQDRKEFGLPWRKYPERRKPPTIVPCMICGIEFGIRRRRVGYSHICSNAECRSELGRQTVAKREAKKQ